MKPEVALQNEELVAASIGLMTDTSTLLLHDYTKPLLFFLTSELVGKFFETVKNAFMFHSFYHVNSFVTGSHAF